MEVRHLFFLLLLTISSAQSSIDGEDKEVMVDLKNSILATNNTGFGFGFSFAGDYCFWSGIQCNNDNRVLSIDLSSRSLSGHLPPSINSLSYLQTLYLHNNSFYGSVPSLSNLTSLTEVDFSDNNFTTISPGIFSGLTSLHHLALSNNPNLTAWELPSELMESVNLVTIFAHGCNLRGRIPDFLGSFRSLQNLSLSHNNFTGTIPTVLTSLPDLVNVDISSNKLEGQMPLFRPGVTVLAFGNNLEPEKHHREKKSKHDKILQWVLFSAVICLIILMVCFCFAMAKWFENRPVHDVESVDELLTWTGSPIEYDFEVLERATDKFNEQKVLGRGGFGVVYKGELPDGTLVAVKRLSDCGSISEESFECEVHALSRTCHQNLVKLYGYSASHGGILVYEYMSKGSLDKWIFESDNRKGFLKWPMKKRIMLDVAKGLCYLHEECNDKDKILHRDIKPSNVVLDESLNAKLCDFGLAKFLSKDKSSTATQASGSYGYKAPELVYQGRRTEKSDVYSYGVVVLETVFEKKNLDHRNRSTSLIELIKSKVDVDPLSFIDLIDDLRHDDMLKETQQVQMVVQLALWCLQIDPKTRPSMSEVVKVLEDMI